jgi:TonB family protein
MHDYSNDIKRYLSGEMTPSERHALEKRALSDPFLADALEGAQELSLTDFEQEVAGINHRIEERVSVSAAKPKQVFFSPMTYRIAAGLVLLAAVSILLWKMADTEAVQKPVALNEPMATSDSSKDVATERVGGSEPGPIALAEKSVTKKEAVSKNKVTEEISLPKETEKAGVEVSDETVATAQPTQEVASAPVITEEKTVAQVQREEAPPSVAVTDDEKQQRAKEVEEVKRESARKAVSKSTAVLRSAIANQVSGKVISAEDGTPLPGVNVIVKGTSFGTVTDQDGNYQLQVPESNATLLYSFIGLQPKEAVANDSGVADVEMSLDVTQLSEMVVTGYGAAAKDEVAPTLELAHPEPGTRAFKTYLEKNVRYPERALSNKVEGRVTIEFFVEPDGSLTDFTVIKGIGSGCDEELIRLVKEGPKWTPTKRNNAPIRDKAKVRLKFSLPTR